MTLPNERFRAVASARTFMRDLLDPKKTPRVPSKVRRRAYWTLRHYPWDSDMAIAAKHSPDIFEGKGQDETNG